MNVRTVGRQSEKSLKTRELVLKSTVALIRKEGLALASPVRIAQHTGLSWGGRAASLWLKGTASKSHCPDFP